MSELYKWRWSVYLFIIALAVWFAYGLGDVSPSFSCGEENAQKVKVTPGTLAEWDAELRATEEEIVSTLRVLDPYAQYDLFRRQIAILGWYGRYVLYTRRNIALLQATFFQEPFEYTTDVYFENMCANVRENMAYTRSMKARSEMIRKHFERKQNKESQSDPKGADPKNRPLTVKQEKACQAYVECGDKSKAYRTAYNTTNMKPATVNRAAKELFDNPKMTAREQELRAEHRKRHDVTVDTLTEEYEEARELASDIKQPASMVSATTGKAKLHGLVRDKQEITGKDGGPVEVVDMTPDAVRKEVDALFAEYKRATDTAV